MMGGGSPWYKNKAVIGVIVVVVIVLGFLLFRGGGDSEGAYVGNEDNASDTQTMSTEPKAGEIAVVGKLACTPLKSGGTPTQEECVLGLMGNDGKFYAIDTSKVESADKNIGPSSDVKIVGTYTAVAPNSEEAGIFRYDGVMAVRLMVVN